MMKLKYIEKFKLMKYSKFIVGIIIGLLIAGISIYYASTILFDSAGVGYDNAFSGLASDNVQDAIDELNGICPFVASPNVQSFKYTGYVQTYVAPSTGTYSLEVCGAQGGNVSNTWGSQTGGKGGCATGTTTLTAGQILYVFVGGQGGSAIFSGTAAGGYNGGGSATASGATCYGGGGGATHISKTNTLLKDTAVTNLYIVAGGGGGGNMYTASDGTRTSWWFGGNGGTGGGTTGGNGTSNKGFYGQGGTQSAGGYYGGAYGQGAMTGGGGYYGGGRTKSSGAIGDNPTAGGGGGGSGYIGGVSAGTWTSTNCANSSNLRTGAGCAYIAKQ